jgi:hypothetical protein
MTLRIEIMQHALRIETRRIPQHASFGRPAPDLTIGAATLLCAASVLTSLAQIAGML